MADKVTIIQGENSSFTVKLRDGNGDPFDVTAFDKFKICLQGANAPIEITEVANVNGSIVTLGGNSILGLLTVQIKSQDTLLLLEEERMDIDLELNNAATPNPRRAKFKNVLTVLSSLC